ncbi:MAG TPA: glycosyltransferase family 2 protein [Daejeonella sp.]|nr:glycosyltransferase family 2 protein [Daejeonella sp.]
MHSVTATLLISTYNWPQALDLVLLSVLKQTVLPLEVVIADDGSGPETRNLIENYRKQFQIPVKHIWHEDQGFRKTQILNKAIRQINGEYIIQIDGDIVLHPRFIEDHLQNIQPGYFVKGSRGMLDKEKTTKVLQSRNIDFTPFQWGLSSRINATRLTTLSPLFYGPPEKTRDFKGCNFAVWKKDFIAVNGYNNALTGWGHEDIELAARLVNLGIKRRHLKMTAVCFHLHHQLNCRKQENSNLQVYYKTLDENISTCSNGYAQTD